MNAPLSISLPTSTAKTAAPVIANGALVIWRLTDIREDQVENKGTVIKFFWDLVNPAPLTDGTTLLPGQFGSKHIENVRLYDKNTEPGKIPARSIQQLSQLIDACLGTGDADNKKGKPPRPDFDASCQATMLGKTVAATMKNRTGDYEGHEFGKVQFPEDVKA